MTRDDIIRMAREVGIFTKGHPMNPWSVYPEELQRFAELVAAAEREKNKRFKVNEWQQLTDDEIGQAALFVGCDFELDDGALVIRLCRAIEAKLKEKNE